MNLLGCPYPIVNTPQGLLPTVYDTNVIKADLLQLILTNPGERVMMPEYGTALRNLIFEPNDPLIYDRVKAAINAAIAVWEPRIVVQEVTVTDSAGSTNQDVAIAANMNSNTIYIAIRFFVPDKINAVENLVIQIPTGV
jgi:phage baseplate assembly protein W